MKIGDYFREKREQKGLSLRNVALKASITSAYLSQFETNLVKNPPSEEVLINLSNALNFSKEEQEEFLRMAALERTPDMIKKELSELRQRVESNAEFVPASEFTKIPVFSHVLAGTDGACIYPEPEYYVDFPYVRNGSEVGAFIVKGDSMEPRIFEGDLVAVKLGVVIENGQPGVFFYNGDTIVKIYRPLPDGRIILESLNYTKYSPIQIQEYDDFKIIGKVFKVIGNW